ncbi:MAG TPA: hypothetical protein VJH03_24975 [Blastocatellia bacterium]|nr:hypothetical protein [Blastocatellia bacterium]
MKADIKPLPAFVKRIESTAIARGDQIGPFKVWPTARPAVTLEPGESVSIGVRIRLDAGETGGLQLASKDTKRAACELTREPNGPGYWLRIAIQPISEAGGETEKILLKTAGPNPQTLTIHLTTRVPAENLSVTPRTIELGEVPIANLTTGRAYLTRIGIRKAVGSFRLKAVSSTLAFLKFEPQTIVDGSNYLIRVGVDPQKLPSGGMYGGVIQIETDDAGTPRVDVTITLTLVNR